MGQKEKIKAFYQLYISAAPGLKIFENGRFSFFCSSDI